MEWSENVGADDMTLLTELTTEALTRDGDNGWTRHEVDEIPEHREPELLKPFAHAWVSPHSLTIGDTKRRTIIGTSVSNGELSRLYLKRTMSNALEAGGNRLLAKRVPWHKGALQFENRGPAYFFEGQTGGPFEMVDIKACYASLYTRMTIDMVYRPDTDPPLLGLGSGAFPRVDEWLEAKGPRNALWGSTLARYGREWRHGVVTENAFPNRFFAPDLKGFVYDAAHAIASEAKSTFHALSWAVDGGVFRPGEGQAFSHWLGETWGLDADIRAEGPGWLFGPSSYQIGPTVTADVKAGRAKQSEPMMNLRRQSSRTRDWLADVFKERAA